MRRHAVKPLSDDDQIARYAHVLGEIPRSVADRAYAEAFARLPLPMRRELVEELCAQLPDSSDDAVPDDPDAFAALMRNLHARVALVTCRDAASVALAFVTSRPVAAYYRSGAGSLSIDHQPPWVHDLADHETAPIDSGAPPHFRAPI